MGYYMTYWRDNPPSFWEGTLEFLFGSVLFMTLFHVSVLVVGQVHMQSKDADETKRLSKAQTVGICCKLISAIFAVNTCVVGVMILGECGTVSLSGRHNAVKHYMCFGLPYFFYDIYAMYVVYKEVEIEKALLAVGSENNSVPDTSFRKLFPCFASSRLLLVLHHLLLPVFIFPVFMGGLQSFGGGDCLVAAGFLMEASTPFVAIRKILALLDRKQSIWYLANGAAMTVVFFFCRVLFFPIIYYLYSRELGVSVYETLTHHVPWICSLSMLTLFVPQTVWFGLMLRGGARTLLDAGGWGKKKLQ